MKNLRYADDTILMAASRELKSLLIKVKEERERVGLKLKIQKTKIMPSGPITSWQIDRETMEMVRDFILRGSKITANGDCSHEIKRRLLLGRKAMTNLDSLLKSRDISLPTNVCLVKALLNFKPTFSLSSFTFIKRLFSFSSLSALRVVSSAYLMLLIFLPAILIPACKSSSPVFHMMYSAYKLNKQSDNIQP